MGFAGGVGRGFAVSVGRGFAVCVEWGFGVGLWLLGCPLDRGVGVASALPC